MSLLCRAGLTSLLVAASATYAGAERNVVLPDVVGATEMLASDPRSGLGLSGYDPVSYVVDIAPRAGIDRYEIAWGGVAWRFASAANLAAFRRNPQAFLPRIGGYDAAAAASGRIASADPRIFAVLAGRLYVFRTPEGRERFLSEDAARDAAEQGWSRVRDSLVAG